MHACGRGWQVGSLLYVLAVAALAVAAATSPPHDWASLMWMGLFIATLPTGYLAQLPIYLLTSWVADAGSGGGPVGAGATPLAVVTFVLAYISVALVNVALLRLSATGFVTITKRCARIAAVAAPAESPPRS